MPSTHSCVTCLCLVGRPLPVWVCARVTSFPGSVMLRGLRARRVPHHPRATARCQGGSLGRLVGPLVEVLSQQARCELDLTHLTERFSWRKRPATTAWQTSPQNCESLSPLDDNQVVSVNRDRQADDLPRCLVRRRRLGRKRGKLIEESNKMIQLWFRNFPALFICVVWKDLSLDFARAKHLKLKICYGNFFPQKWYLGDS